MKDINIIKQYYEKGSYIPTNNITNQNELDLINLVNYYLEELFSIYAKCSDADRNWNERLFVYNKAHIKFNQYRIKNWYWNRIEIKK